MPTRPGISSEYRTAISDEVREEERLLGAAKARDWADYCARCAKISAFKTALDRFDRILETYLEEDEKDELET